MQEINIARKNNIQRSDSFIYQGIRLLITVLSLELSKIHHTVSYTEVVDSTEVPLNNLGLLRIFYVDTCQEGL